MAGSALFVDVWDADALMHVGTLALPLRALMRQQKGVVKTAMVRHTKNKLRRSTDCYRGSCGSERLVQSHVLSLHDIVLSPNNPLE